MSIGSPGAFDVGNGVYTKTFKDQIVGDYETHFTATYAPSDGTPLLVPAPALNLRNTLTVAVTKDGEPLTGHCHPASQYVPKEHYTEYIPRAYMLPPRGLCPWAITTT